MRDPLESKYLAGHHYGLNDFDKHMCLQPGLVIWLVIAFLMRPYIVMVMSFAQMGNRMGTIDLVYRIESGLRWMRWLPCRPYW